MKANKLLVAVAYVSFIGVLLSVYLLWQQFFRPAFQPCNINSWINCDAVIKGPVAKTLGLPTPLYGFIGYLVMIGAALTHRKKLLISMATFGLLFCAYIAYQELVVLRVVCPVCIMCQITMITAFTMSVIIVKQPDNPSGAA